MNICTNIEQSQYFIDNGIDVNTADTIYNIFDKSYIRHDTPIDIYHRPAWSLSALMNIIKTKCEYNYDLNIHYDDERVGANIPIWRITLYPIDDTIYPLIESTDEDLLNCAVDILKKMIKI